MKFSLVVWPITLILAGYIKCEFAYVVCLSLKKKKCLMTYSIILQCFKIKSSHERKNTFLLTGQKIIIGVRFYFIFLTRFSEVKLWLLKVMNVGW